MISAVLYQLTTWALIQTGVAKAALGERHPR